MKKTFTINISGTIFHIEEDAYEVLQKYLTNLRNHFGSGEEGNEIIADIEARIAEIFLEKSSTENSVVTVEMVNEVIEIMGTPEDITGDCLPGLNTPAPWRPSVSGSRGGRLGGCLAVSTIC